EVNVRDLPVNEGQVLRATPPVGEDDALQRGHGVLGLAERCVSSSKQYRSLDALGAEATNLGEDRDGLARVPVALEEELRGSQERIRASRDVGDAVPLAEQQVCELPGRAGGLVELAESSHEVDVVGQALERSLEPAARIGEVPAVLARVREVHCRGDK